QTVREISDGFVICEVCLFDPTFRLIAKNTVQSPVRSAFRDNPKPGSIVYRLRSEHDALRSCFFQESLRACSLHQVRECKLQFSKSLVRNRRNFEYPVPLCFEVGTNKFGELTSLGHVDLV